MTMPAHIHVMDRPRAPVSGLRRHRWLAIVAVVVSLVVVIVTLGLRRLRTAAPAVDRSSVDRKSVV